MEHGLTNKTTFRAIGIMSGTSLDGLDLVAAVFELYNGKWNFSLHAANTLPYPETWENRLKNAHRLSGEALAQLDADYGKYLGEQALLFVRDNSFAPDLIASHGHTVFHRPEKGYTLQIGNGHHLAAETNVLTIADFRTGDVALGGQGAPLVPIGDRLLFSDFDFCLNLGGFANISFETNGRSVAFDNCPVNFVLNRFARKQGMAFDKNGELGRKGKIHEILLEKLNTLPYYLAPPPKSLGREWVEDEFLPVLDQFSIPDRDKLRTVYEHIAIQIAKATSGKGKMLVTGGGAFNTFLVDRIRAHTATELIIPEKEIVEFKEAIVFAFLGVLRVKGINNCLASVTGARRDSCGGVVFYP